MQNGRHLVDVGWHFQIPVLVLPQANSHQDGCIVQDDSYVAAWKMGCILHLPAMPAWETEWDTLKKSGTKDHWCVEVVVSFPS